MKCQWWSVQKFKELTVDPTGICASHTASWCLLSSYFCFSMSILFFNQNIKIKNSCNFNCIHCAIWWREITVKCITNSGNLEIYAAMRVNCIEWRNQTEMFLSKHIGNDDGYNFWAIIQEQRCYCLLADSTISCQWFYYSRISFSVHSFSRYTQQYTWMSE